MDVTGIGTAVTGIKDILGMFFPDKTEEDKAKMEQAFNMFQAQQELQKAQIVANTAASAPGATTTFRDGAGWVSVFGLGMIILKAPIEWAAALMGHPVQLSAVDTSVAMTTLSALLGIGAMHMNESIKTQ